MQRENHCIRSQLILDSCPNGFSLKNRQLCMCDETLTSFESVECDMSKLDLLKSLQCSYWMQPILGERRHFPRSDLGKQLPKRVLRAKKQDTPSYALDFSSSNDSDSQCAKYRTGIFLRGLSVLGTV